jgi:hypothetical protein
MPKKRRYDSMTPVSLAHKIMPTLVGRGIPPEVARVLAMGHGSKYASAFGRYRELYERIKSRLAELGVPPAMYGLVRSFAFKLYKEMGDIGGDACRQYAVIVNETTFKFPAEVVDVVVEEVCRETTKETKAVAPAKGAQ